MKASLLICPIVGAALLAGCASTSLTTPQIVSVKEVDENAWPSVIIDGQKKKVVTLSIKGPATLVAKLQARVQQEAWRVEVVSTDGTVMQIGTTGKTLTDVYELKSRIERGAFGDLKVDLFIIPATGA